MCSAKPSRAALIRAACSFSNLSVLDFSKKKTHTVWCAFSFWRYRPDLNWRMRVLQTLALPLGHGTIWKSGTRGYVPDFWSGRRGSNSLPPPWQGGALPDELRPQIWSDRRNRTASIPNSLNIWCLRSESNQRHADFQSAALPTELQRHMRKQASSIRKFALFLRPRTDSNRRPPA